ncbi:LysM peptidoglycan-binding domain-containing protein [Inquilinus limosus]|uniref:LysM peptidoglycan-binding domain-containing protein n=1 Tax=Inquilinus limosus TaxID=171674 RepID=UPI003F164564
MHGRAAVATPQLGRSKVNRGLLIYGAALALFPASSSIIYMELSGSSGPQPVELSSPASPRPPGIDRQTASLTPADEASAPAIGGDDAGQGVSAGQGAQLRFDAIRINSGGYQVIAGRGPAGARITLFDGEVAIGSVDADANGDWVFVSEVPIAPGDHQLSLSATRDGHTTVSADIALVVVPQRGEGAAGPDQGGDGKPVVILMPKAGGASTILQAPDEAAAALPGLSIDVIDYDEEGAVIISGHGAAGSLVRLYLDNSPIGEGWIDTAGIFRIPASRPIAPGTYRLRADQLDVEGRVTDRTETPFQRAAPADIAVAEGRIVVQPGNNLWRIARGAYGQGVLFTVIYQANRVQIRDPDLIYPGQILTVPPARAPVATGRG